MPDVSSGPNFYNIDGRIKLFNSLFMHGKFVVHCNFVFPIEHPPYVLARTYCVFNFLGLYLSIYGGYYFYCNSNVKKFDELDKILCLCYGLPCE